MNNLQGFSLATFAYYGLNLIIIGLIFFSSVRIYLKFSNYNELEILKKGNASLGWVLGGMTLGLAVAISLANMSHGDTIESIIKFIIVSTIQIIFYLFFPKFSNSLQEEVRENNNSAIGILLGLMYVSFGLINGASFY